MTWSRFQHEPVRERHDMADAAERLQRSRATQVVKVQAIVDSVHAGLQAIPAIDAIIADELAFDRITMLTLVLPGPNRNINRRWAATRIAIARRARAADMSTPQIAKALGLRSHTTLIERAR
jgi:chromosomal replication initiation ATPase DnaA